MQAARMQLLWLLLHMPQGSMVMLTVQQAKLMLLLQQQLDRQAQRAWRLYRWQVVVLRCTMKYWRQYTHPLRYCYAATTRTRCVQSWLGGSVGVAVLCLGPAFDMYCLGSLALLDGSTALPRFTDFGVTAESTRPTASAVLLLSRQL